MALAFGAEGDNLLLVDVDKDALESLCAELRAEYPGQTITTLNASVDDEQRVNTGFDEFAGLTGGIDVLLNNAGISANGSSLEMGIDTWRRAIDINLTGVFICAQAAGRHMVPRGSGVIVNTSSIWGVSTAANRAPYCAAKAAVSSLTGVLASEWGPHNVRVVAMGPGYVDTAMVRGVEAEGKLDVGEVERRTPLGRLAKPGEIADLALFLASDKAAYITGQTVLIDGGWVANGFK